MPKSENQKIKLLYIADYLTEKTDEKHSVTSNDIIDMLASNNISAERKSIFSDIDALKNFGYDIDVAKGRTGGIRLLSKKFELAELKLLVDAVQASRFITEKKSYSLIKKLGELTSEYERKELQRLVFISNRIKTENESIYYNTDNIYSAINNDKQITFFYFNYAADKKKHYHNNKQPIKVSPFALQYDSENYYLIAFDSLSGKTKHYRVDKIENICITDESRDGKGNFRKFDVAKYSNATLKMYSGNITEVTLKTPDKYAGALIDKFGKKIFFIPTSDGEYTVTVEAALTPTLYSWIFTFGGEIKITQPQEAVDGYKEQLKKALSTI